MNTSKSGSPIEEKPKQRKPRKRTFTDIDMHILGLIAASEGKPISKSELIKKAHCSIRSADRAVARLKTAGLVRVEERFDENGGRLANAYFLTGRGKKNEKA